MGGVYAVANIRGGGGVRRSLAQSRHVAKKQNVFDDFIAAAEYLIRANTRRPRSSRSEGSRTAACSSARWKRSVPICSARLLPAVGVMDMLRFQEFTIGRAWVSEYGSADGAEQFKNALRVFAASQHRAGTAYPPTLVRRPITTTAYSRRTASNSPRKCSEINPERRRFCFASICVPATAAANRLQDHRRLRRYVRVPTQEPAYDAAGVVVSALRSEKPVQQFFDPASGAD